MTTARGAGRLRSPGLVQRPRHDLGGLTPPGSETFCVRQLHGQGVARKVSSSITAGVGSDHASWLGDLVRPVLLVSGQTQDRRTDFSRGHY